LKYSLGSILLLLFCALQLNAQSESEVAQHKRFQFSSQKMGSPFNIVFIAPDSLTAHFIRDRCFKLTDSLTHIFSDYDSTSEISKINQNAGIQPTPVSPQMMDMLILCKKAYLQSHGSYNIAIGPLSALWRLARKTKTFPTTSSLQAAKLKCLFNTIQLDTIRQQIFLPQIGMRLDVGGIGKGYIAQLVLNHITSFGIGSAMVDAGGKIVMTNPIRGTKGWKIGINVSESKQQILPQYLVLQNCAVATSGDVYQFFDYKGVRYSHIIDPATGLGITSLRNVTVIAQDGATADWLATACSILSVQAAKKLVRAYGGEMRIAVRDRKTIHYDQTNGFHLLLH
jgi:thiamine biosynthesis lipoprotein